MFRNILVPLDGSPLAEAALPHAETLTRKFQGRLTLLRVNTTPHVKPDPVTGADPRRVYLEALAEPLRESGLSVECKVVVGNPSNCIIELAESDATDLVVMSSHGRTGLARWVYGSVAEKVLHHAHCPLMLVRNG